MNNFELNAGRGFFRTTNFEKVKAEACEGLNGLMRFKSCYNMVLRLLEYSIYNTSKSKIQVKFELNNIEKSANFDRVKFSIILNTVSK